MEQFIADVLAAIRVLMMIPEHPIGAVPNQIYDFLAGNKTQWLLLHVTLVVKIEFTIQPHRMKNIQFIDLSL